MFEARCEEWELWYVFSIHHVKPAAVWWRTEVAMENNKFNREIRGSYLFILAHFSEWAIKW